MFAFGCDSKLQIRYIYVENTSLVEDESLYKTRNRILSRLKDYRCIKGM